METKPALINEAVFNLDNYLDWSDRVKTYLMNQDLWHFVVPSSQAPTPNTESASKDWSEKNAKALHAIQMFCGPDTFSDIREISSAEFAWDTLAEKYRLNMETKPALINEAAFNQDNYLDWSIRVKTYLMTRDLWDVVESSGEAPTRKTKSPSKGSSEKNAEALHAIQMFCGQDTISDIREKSSAKSAWDTLEEKYRSNMETKPTVINEVNQDNYLDWSIRVKTYLMAQNLWEVVESSGEAPPTTKTKSPSKGSSNKNGEALRAIQMFCGPNTCSEIGEISSAKDAWDTLEEKYSIATVPSLYSGLCKALQSGDWTNAESELCKRPQLKCAKITVTGGTVLHVAVVAGQVNIVEELVKLMAKKYLEIRDDYGFTALACTSYNGNRRMAECLLGKNMDLINIATEEGNMPVILALNCGQLDLARYFYLLSEDEILKPGNATMGASVVSQAIYSKALDIALRAIQSRPKLVLTKDRYGKSPLYALACMPDAFPSGNPLAFWKRWICFLSCIDFGSCSAYKTKDIDIQATGPTNEIRLNVQPAENRSNHENIIGSGIKHPCEMKLAHCQSKELLSIMVKGISTSTIKKRRTGLLIEAILHATKEGIFEFVFEMVKANPELVWSHDETSTSIFSVAVQYRQAKIFSLIYGHDMKTALATHGDSVYDNNLLHMAGMSDAASTSLNDIAGAAFQMQRELQWFKEVESIVPSTVPGKLNKAGLTPRQLFTKNHEDMMGKGEKWMKDTASSCTVVGALIVTIMFAAAFTVPGGNDQNKGFPIFLNENLFMVFIISDALSLFSSSTSVLMFLGILTSRYAEDDFFKSLPRKMIIGLSTLFFSIAAMMTAFSAALLLMLRGKSWIVLPVICLASVPVALFVLMQSPLLGTMIVSTCRPGIFDRKMKSRF